MLPNWLPALLGEVCAPRGFGTHATRDQVLREVEMPSILLGILSQKLGHPDP